MGIHDRDYMQADAPGSPGGGTPAGGFGVGRLSGWSVTTWLLAINIAVFLLDRLLGGTGLAYVRVILSQASGIIGDAYIPVRQAAEVVVPAGLRVDAIDRVSPLNRWGFFSFESALAQLQLWRWFTFQFLHASLGHIFGNMLGLFFFGSMIEQFLGRRRFLVFYLACGVAGPLLYLLFVLANVLQAETYTPLVGASAGVFGILAAAAVIAPDTMVLVYGIVPVKLRTLALVLLGVAALTVFTQGRNAGGEAAHLGGAALGYLLIRHPEWLKWAEAGPKVPVRRPKSSPNMRYHGWR